MEQSSEQRDHHLTHAILDSQQLFGKHTGSTTTLCFLGIKRLPMLLEAHGLSLMEDGLFNTTAVMEAFNAPEFVFLRSKMDA